MSELRAYQGFCHYYSGYIMMYAEYPAPITAMLEGNREYTKKGFKKALVWNDESDCALRGNEAGTVLEQALDDGRHVLVAFWTRVLAEGQRGTWMPYEKEAYAIVMALRKWAGYIPLLPFTVCTDNQSLQSWHKEHVDTPSGPASQRARWHETLAKVGLMVVYIPGKDNTLADCLTRWAYRANKGMRDVSAHGDEAHTTEGKKILNVGCMIEEERVKRFVVMAADAQRVLSPTSTSSQSSGSKMTGPTTMRSRGFGVPAEYQAVTDPDNRHK